MKVFLDTNVLLDVITQRAPFYAESALIWSLVEQRKLRGLVSATSFTNVYYIVRRLKDRRTADRAVRLLRDLFMPVACDEQVLDQAIGARFEDFEDAIQYFSAVRAGASYLITRDQGHFPEVPHLLVLSPAEFLAACAMKHD